MPSDDLSVHEAKREPVFLSVLLSGPSDGGKTYSALTIARGISPKGTIVLIDTETKPATLYADEFRFLRIALKKPFTPERYREAVRLAKTKNPAIIIIDSVTHEWNGSGGILRELDDFQAKNPKAPQFLFWKNATPRHDRAVEAFTTPTCHMIVCCRGKERYAVEVEVDDNGRKKMVPKRIGLRPIQRKDFFFDFMISFVLDPGTHNARILNNMTKTFRDWTPRPLVEADGKALLVWANLKAKAKS